MEFSDSRLWESNLRMLDVGAVGLESRASMEPRWEAAEGPFTPLWDGNPEELLLEACSVGVDVATGGGALGSCPPSLVCDASLS